MQLSNSVIICFTVEPERIMARQSHLNIHNTGFSSRFHTETGRVESKNSKMNRFHVYGRLQTTCHLLMFLHIFAVKSFFDLSCNTSRHSNHTYTRKLLYSSMIENSDSIADDIRINCFLLGSDSRQLVNIQHTLDIM